MTVPEYEGPSEHLREVVAALERRLEELAARVETLDASFVRHQDGNEGAFDRVDENLRSVERRLDEHGWQEHSR